MEVVLDYAIEWGFVDCVATLDIQGGVAVAVSRNSRLRREGLFTLSEFVKNTSDSLHVDLLGVRILKQEFRRLISLCSPCELGREDSTRQLGSNPNIRQPPSPSLAE